MESSNKLFLFCVWIVAFIEMDPDKLAERNQNLSNMTEGV